MEFRLAYQGKLKGNGDATEKHRIRQALHPQLAALWKQKPLTDYSSFLPGGKNQNSSPFIHPLNAFTFVPLVVAATDLIAEIDIIFLRPEAPGTLVSSGGDIDNRIKTLLDALRMPHNIDELPTNAVPSDEEAPFFCLLEDDSLITHIAVTTDRLLLPVAHQLDVLLVLHVRLKVTRATISYFALGI